MRHGDESRHSNRVEEGVVKGAVVGQGDQCRQNAMRRRRGAAGAAAYHRYEFGKEGLLDIHRFDQVLKRRKSRE